MKKVICILLCILLCGCTAIEPNDILVSGDTVENDSQSETQNEAEDKVDVESQDEMIAVYDHRFEKAIELDGLELYYFGSDGLYRESKNLDEEGKAILYKHRGDSLEKLERVPYGYVDDYGATVVARAIYSTSDGEYVWFLGLVGEYDGKYILCNEFLPDTIYLLSEDDAEDILPNEAFGFTRQEYQESDRLGSFEWGWADYLSKTPPICGKMLAYTSDKFVIDGEIVHNRGIWVFNLETREEYRIDFENEKNEFLDVECWIDEDTLIFSKGNELYIHKPSLGTGYEPFYTVDSQNYSYSVYGTHLWLSEKDGYGVKIIELDDMTEHEFALDRARNLGWDHYENKYVATAEDQKSLIVLDLETDTFEVFEWYFSDTYIEFTYFNDNGDVIVIEEADAMSGSWKVEGIYKLVR